MNKTTYLGASVVLLALGYYAGKRHYGSDLGSTGISQLDYAKNMPLLGIKVGRQVAYAQAGKWLTSYDQAEDVSSFSKAPAYDVRAHYTVAYWTAVAARVLHSRTLATRAGAALAKGNALFSLPGSSLLTGSVSSIIQAGAAALKKSSQSSKIAPIIEILSEVGSAEAVASQQQARSASSVTTAPARAKEALSPENLLRAAAGLQPRDPNAPSVWVVWGGRVLLLGGGVIAARWAWKRFGAQRALPAPVQEGEA